MSKQKTKKKIALRELALRHRPREKARQLGLTALSDHELLALMIGSGQKNSNVLEIAKKVEKVLHSSTPHVAELCKINGIGQILATKILASLEFAERFNKLSHFEQVDSPDKIFTLSLEIHDKKQEYCLAFYLNGRQELLHKKIIAVGGLNYNFLEPRDIFAPAFSLGASGLILVHNHPSGNPEPSDEDLLLTEKVRHLAELLGVKFLDHLIVSKKNYFSLREHFRELLH